MKNTNVDLEIIFQSWPDLINIYTYLPTRLPLWKKKKKYIFYLKKNVVYNNTLFKF